MEKYQYFHKEQYNGLIKRKAKILAAIPCTYDSSRYSNAVRQDLQSSISCVHADVKENAIGAILGYFIGTCTGICVLTRRLLTASSGYDGNILAAILLQIIWILIAINFYDIGRAVRLVVIGIVIGSVIVGVALVVRSVINGYSAINGYSVISVVLLGPATFIAACIAIGYIISYVRATAYEMFHKYGPTMSTKFGALGGATMRDIFEATDNYGNDMYLIVEMDEPFEYVIGYMDKINEYVKSRKYANSYYRVAILLEVIGFSFGRFDVIDVEMFRKYCKAMGVAEVDLVIEKLRTMAIPKYWLKYAIDSLYKSVKYPNFQDIVALTDKYSYYAAIWKLWLFDQM